MNKNHRIIAISLVFTLAVFSQPSLAATLYVEKWGDDANNCTKANPCLTINRAKNLSKKNGRIVVGPGIYRENVWIGLNLNFEPLEGLKLESTAGRHATFIQAANSSFHTVNISQSRVQFGKKKKGFTVSGATTAGNAGINIDNASVSNIRIEGNEARSNSDGIVLRGEKILLQNNVATGNLVHGIECFTCTQVTIRDNIANRNLVNGMLIYFSSQVVIERNVASGNDGVGISTDTTSNTNRLKIRDNVVTFNQNTGIRAGDVGGGLVQGNIASQNVGHGLFVREGPLLQGGKVKGNLLVGNEISGIDFDDTDLSNIDAEKNTSVDNDGEGFLFSANGAPIGSFKSNNSFANDEPGPNCGINNTSVQLLSYTSHFFSGDDVGCGPIIGTSAAKPSALQVRKASGL
ncbi:MAG: right-handed parallel beta-helix repeat-containing protein [bacterium]